jgi:hypothetical protein
MIYKDKQIRELYDLKHRNDKLSYENYNWEDNILNNSLSPLLFQNETNTGFLDRIRYMISMFFENFHIVRNFKNYLVDKDYSKHNN